MTFYIYNAKGYQHPYVQGQEWRNVDRRENVSSLETFDKKPVEPPEVLIVEDALEKPEEYVEEEIYTIHPEKEEGERALVASQIMHRPVQTLKPDDTLQEAFRFFCSHRFRHIPIVSEEGALQGILSDRCQAYAMVKEGTKFSTEKRLIKDVMVEEVLTAQPMALVSDIANVFIEERIGCMPIVDTERKLVGIITRSDILRTIVRIQIGELRI